MKCPKCGNEKIFHERKNGWMCGNCGEFICGKDKDPYVYFQTAEEILKDLEKNIKKKK